ncbi:MAG: hypothetical protein WC934_06255 [Acidithiobacillus sp.]|jgi:hypothetical protein|uniref:hypothetical protein n=1 Tax=Acidithiobacillus sp. TaxID=1872118 RepID=UPI0035606581
MEKPSNKENDSSKLNCNQIKMFLEDEQKANNDYKALNLLEIANDEHDHAKLLKKWAKEKKCSI